MLCYSFTTMKVREKKLLKEDHDQTTHVNALRAFNQDLAQHHASNLKKKYSKFKLSGCRLIDRALAYEKCMKSLFEILREAKAIAKDEFNPARIEKMRRKRMLLQ